MTIFDKAPQLAVTTRPGSLNELTQPGSGHAEEAGVKSIVPRRAGGDADHHVVTAQRHELEEAKGTVDPSGADSGELIGGVPEASAAVHIERSPAELSAASGELLASQAGDAIDLTPALLAMGADGGHQGSRLTIETIRDDGLEVAVHGRLDRSCQPMLTERLARLVSSHPAALRIDFTDVTSIDPTVVEAFALAGRILAHNGGRLEVFGANPQVATAIAHPQPTATSETPRSDEKRDRTEALLRRRVLRLQDVLLRAPGEVWQQWWPTVRSLAGRVSADEPLDLEGLHSELATVEHQVETQTGPHAARARPRRRRP